MRTVLEELLCICFILLSSAVNLLYVQLRMFDLNGDGKLGLSEMARWVHLQLSSFGSSTSLHCQQHENSFCQFFVNRLLPVHENFLLKFEVRFHLRIKISTAAETSDWSCIKEFRQWCSVLSDSLCKDYWSSNHCLDIWALTQMYFPAYVKSIRIWIMLSDVSFKTLPRPLIIPCVPLGYWHFESPHANILF